MSLTIDKADALPDLVLAAHRVGKRRLVALAGAPASGKSTLAETLAEALTARGCLAQVVPMDGFHLDNTLLIERGLLHRKGAPETFDVDGFRHLVKRLHDAPEVIYPTFDRARDIAIAGSGRVGDGCDTVILEGNYLLFDAPDWRELTSEWDISIRLDVPLPVLHQRLIERWLSHGMTRQQAEARAAENDLPNAQRIAAAQLPADIVARLS